MKLGKIVLGQNKRKYTHDLSHDVNTTLGFGNVIPSMCQYMSAGDSINLNAKQLVRLAPLPVPTFGRMSVVNRAVFVPAREVFSYYDAMLSNQSVTTTQDGTFIPKQVPVVSSLQLCTMLMFRELGHIGFWHNLVGAEDGKMSRSDDDQSYDAFYEKLTVGGHEIPLPATNYEPFVFFLPEDASLSSCDYLLPLGVNSKGIATHLMGIRLTAKGRRVHSILRSLGYSMTFSDGEKVSALPILAFYKAWFDCYHPKLDFNWHDTNCWNCIMFCREFDLSDVDNGRVFIDELFSVVKDLSDCFYASELDYVSAHKAKLLYDNNDGVQYIDADGHNPNVSRINPENYPVTTGVFSRLSYDALTKLTRYATKDTLIGSKLYDWIRVHYGESVANTLFDQSTNLGSWIVNADISDVISSAETYNSEDNNGDVLGAYAGKGIGFNNGHISFKANDFGYLIILTCVVPKSGYSQGTDPALYGIDTFTLPNPDFDAIGYEATPIHGIIDDGGVSILDNQFDHDLHGVGFGFIPRYSGYKIKKNVISGDFSRLSTRHMYDPYHLDRMVSTTNTKVGNDTFLSVRLNPPFASTAWRYPTKYEWLGNFNRIFYNNGSSFLSTKLMPVSAVPSTEPIDDNFIVQTVFDIKYKSLLKPIRESYDVFDEHTNSGETDTSVSGE